MPDTDGKSPEQAMPVRVIANHLRDYIARLGRVWIEGQVVEVSRRSGELTWLTVRDPHSDASVSVVINSRIVAALNPALQAGAKVLLHVRVEYWARTGKLVMRAAEIRPVGIGVLLAMLEQRKAALAAEGLFAAIRKKRLPAVPRRVGLITGANAQARHDVVTNATRRWPGVVFEIREGPVQGDQAVPAMLHFLRELDALAEVDVIVFARGGGSMEDLLPFSDETLIRAVANTRTPVVSAIGHEQDSPLLDLVADLRASTPTDAGKLVVPDLATELRSLTDARRRLDRSVVTQVRTGQEWLDQLRSRPVLLDPAAWLPRQERDVQILRRRADQALLRKLERAEHLLLARRAQARALSPIATLERGYAVVLGPDGQIVHDSRELADADRVKIKFAAGSARATITQIGP